MTESAEPAAPAAPQERPARPALACVLAWLLPGLGHLYLGKRGRAITFFLVVLVCFTLGISSGGVASLADAQQPLTYLATFDNLALGPIDLIGRRLTYGRIVYRLPDDEADPRQRELLEAMRSRVRRVTYEYGNAFLLTAGLMNMLLILDAFDIATKRKD